MNAADRRRLTPMLGVLAALLLLVLVVLWLGVGRKPSWTGAGAAAGVPPAGTTLPPPDVAPLARFSDVWERPLFSRTRTPEPVSGGGDGSTGELVLTGVILVPGMKMAIVHDKTSGKDYRLVEGRPARNGPSLLELHPRSATVEASGSRLQLRLVPGPAPDSGKPAGSAGPDAGDGQPVPTASAGPGASGMVTRRGEANPEAAAMDVSDPQSDAARARLLKARIESRRRRAAQQQNGGGG